MLTLALFGVIIDFLLDPNISYMLLFEAGMYAGKEALETSILGFNILCILVSWVKGDYSW